MAAWWRVGGNDDKGDNTSFLVDDDDEEEGELDESPIDDGDLDVIAEARRRRCRRRAGLSKSIAESVHRPEHNVNCQLGFRSESHNCTGDVSNNLTTPPSYGHIQHVLHLCLSHSR